MYFKLQWNSLKNTGPLKLKLLDFYLFIYFPRLSHLVCPKWFFSSWVLLSQTANPSASKPHQLEQTSATYRIQNTTRHQNITMHLKSGDNTIEICPKNGRGDERLMNRTWDGVPSFYFYIYLLSGKVDSLPSSQRISYFHLLQFNPPAMHTLPLMATGCVSA